MKRGKPHQQIYRPGSGPLRRSHNVDDTESESNIVYDSRQNPVKNVSSERFLKLKSEGSSPREQNYEMGVISEKLRDMNLRDSPDSKRKFKKPDQTFYVPKPIAQARESTGNSRSNENSSHINVDKELANKNDGHNQININGNLSGSSEHMNLVNNRSKRYSNRRRPSDTSEMQDRSWRPPSPASYHQRRDARQGSEPRNISNQPSNNSGWNRGMRDTRSVEPSVGPTRNYEKINSKPPSGRRHSTVGLESEKRPKINFETLPPRLQKKYLEENKFNTTYIGTHSEGTWDGNSITFQGSSGHPPPTNQQNYPMQNYMGSHQHMQNPHYPMYYTLPHNRPRGRGRLQYGYDNPSMGGLYRSGTPDRMLFESPSNSRPSTPPNFAHKTRSNENLLQSDSRSHTPVQFYRNDDRYKFNDERFNENYNRNNDDRFRNRLAEGRNNNNRSKYHDESYDTFLEQDYMRQTPVSEFKSQVQNTNTPRRAFRESLEAQLSPVSPSTPPDKPVASLVPIPNQILDWSEEVELNDRLEAETFSDALTRSSSMTSLVETSVASQPTSAKKRIKKKKNRKSNGRRRDRSLDDPNVNRSQPKPDPKDNSRVQNQSRHNSYNNVDSNRDFKVPESRGRRRRNSYDKSYERQQNQSRNVSREPSFDRTRRNSNEPENWRDEIRSRNNSETNDRSRNNSEREGSKEPERKHDVKKGGIIVLPRKEPEQHSRPPVLNVSDRPVYPEIQRKPISPGQHQKSLFDPSNPNKPIIVKANSSRVNVPGFSENSEAPPPQLQYTTDQFGNIRPAWYEDNSESWKACHYPTLLRDIKKADCELQFINNSGHILINWPSVVSLRGFLMKSLEYLLCHDLKFCQSENVEQYFWKILFHNIIEMMRKAIGSDLKNKEQYKGFLLYLIDEGTKYFEKLIELLEETYSFRINNYLGHSSQKGLGYVGLALISAQKIFLFLGDLGRYREQVNETSNYGKCRQWYVKAHEINPKNGRPYNQLAVLAVYARRKLDAVYYYMRSLMSSNPVQSARECLISLFDENRKKYEQSERKRREERLERARQHMKEKESESAAGPPSSLRREIWIRPDGGRRVHRTTSAVQEQKPMDSEEEDLAALSSVEVNKRFVTSYLHVHGKLITRIGMESFQEAALQMLKEFRALLQHSPVPLPCNRFLQLLALNMFAVDSTQLKDPQFQAQNRYRSELQERALVVSLQMFNLILERCVSLLQEHIKSKPDGAKSMGGTAIQDVHILLPAVKIWCDWMLCHSSVWNPPPSTQDYRVGPAGDAWSRLASLMNLLEKLDQSVSLSFSSELKDGYEQIRLPEDSVLSGFTPLMFNDQDPTFVMKEVDMESAQFNLRLTKLIFFGTVFLCGLEPPVLKLEVDADFSEYISVVNISSNRGDATPSPPELIDDNDLLVESFSEDEPEENEDAKVADNAPSEIRQLLSRKVELEKRQRTQELHRQRVQKILRQSVVSVHIEIRPKVLVPDTNCFIDYLNMIKTIAGAHVYTLMVPLVVLNELEGLARGGKFPAPSRDNLNPEHVLKVADSAKQALEFLGNRQASIKCVTTKGTTLATFTFTVEDDSTQQSSLRNDDKILATCLVLCKSNKDQQIEGEPRKLYREVVLLTEDRNLRVKALARDVPVRELPDFMNWAGLG